MIKKHFILSVILIVCAGCQSQRQDIVNSFATMPYVCVYPNYDFKRITPGTGIRILGDYEGLNKDNLVSVCEADGKEPYELLKIGPSDYEPVYRFERQEYIGANEVYDAIEDKDLYNVNINNMSFRDVVDWLVNELQIPILLRLDSQELDRCEPVTMKYDKIKVLDFLDRLCKDECFAYEVASRAVIITYDLDRGDYYMNSKTFVRIFGKDALPKDIWNKLFEHGIEFRELYERTSPLSSLCSGSISLFSDDPFRCHYIYNPYVFRAIDDFGKLRALESILDVKRISETKETDNNDKDPDLREIESKMENIIVGHVEYKDEKVSVCIADLFNRFKEKEPEKRGADIQLILEVTQDYNGGVKVSEQNEPVITMIVDDISLGDAIRFICRAANLKYKIYKDKIVIASQSVPFYPLETRSFPVLETDIIENKIEVPSDNVKMDKIEYYLKNRNVSFVKGAKVSYDNERKLLNIVQTAPEFKRMQPFIACLCGYRTKFIFDKTAPVAAKIANLKLGDFVEVKGEMQVKEAKHNGYTFSQPCFLIKDIEVIRNPVQTKLRKYEPAQ